MAAPRRKRVRDRAGDRCEYCHLPQTCTTLPHEVDHVRARKHRGPSTLANYCWACALCNSFKGSNAAGYDPVTDGLVPLFNPRADRWADHFAWRGPTLVGKTAVGRATIDVLRINTPERVEHRRLLVAAGQLILR
jgi:5-methylcytosine-specific restriction endonuclease McrA